MREAHFNNPLDFHEQSLFLVELKLAIRSEAVEAVVKMAQVILITERLERWMDYLCRGTGAITWTIYNSDVKLKSLNLLLAAQERHSRQLNILSESLIK